MKIYTLNGITELKSKGNYEQDKSLKLAPIYMTFERTAYELKFESKDFNKFLIDIGFIRKAKFIEPEPATLINNYAVMEQIFIENKQITQMMITESGIGYLIENIQTIFK